MNFMKRAFLLTLILSIVVMGCGVSRAESSLNIVCTGFPCYDFVRAAAGERANVQMLIKPGSEVHSFEPTPSDVMAVAGCDLFVYIGGESDAWVTDILDSFGNAAPDTLRFFDCIEALVADDTHDHDYDDHTEEYDEHIWTSPQNAMEMMNALADELCKIDPDGSETYILNAKNYNSQIADLDAEISEIVRNAVRKELIFADRFPFLYFAKEYGLEWHAAFPSCSSESEPSAKTIAELIDRVKNDQIPVVYTLELSSGKTARTISEETGAKVMTLYSIQNISGDDFAAGETYLTLMQRNIEALREGLN